MPEGADTEVVKQDGEDNGGQSEPVAEEDVSDDAREAGEEGRGGQEGLEEDGGE